jgi:hypothetical protein
MRTTTQNAIGIVGDFLILSALLGLFARKRQGACWSFTAYLTAVFSSESLISAWPDRFYRSEFWLAKESVHALLKFAIALEVGLRTFQAFPGAKNTLRRVLLAGLGLTYLGVLAVPGQDVDYGRLANQVLPRILNGTVWLFTAVVALILWYRLPVAPLHKEILAGFVPYLLVFTVALNAVHAFGWEVRAFVGYAHTSAYLAVLVYWNLAAWRAAGGPDRAPGLPARVSE